MTKVEAVLPETLRRVVLETPLFAPALPCASAMAGELALLRRAIGERRLVHFSYAREDGEASERDARPLGLYFWGRKWTLAAWCELRTDYRSFRPDRMRDLSCSTAASTRPTASRSPASVAKRDPADSEKWEWPQREGRPQGNSIAAIDPRTGKVGEPVWVGSEPNLLAVSDDGSTLWVVLERAFAIRRVALPGLVPGIQFVVQTDFGRELGVEDIEVQPGNPDVIAVSRQVIIENSPPSSAGVAIYENGVRRPLDGPLHVFANRIEFGRRQLVGDDRLRNLVALPSRTTTSPLQISLPRRRTLASATRSTPRPADKNESEKPMVVPREPAERPGVAQNAAVAAVSTRPAIAPPCTVSPSVVTSGRYGRRTATRSCSHDSSTRPSSLP